MKSHASDHTGFMPQSQVKKGIHEQFEAPQPLQNAENNSLYPKASVAPRSGAVTKAPPRSK